MFVVWSITVWSVICLVGYSLRSSTDTNLVLTEGIWFVGLLVILLADYLLDKIVQRFR